MSGRYEEQQQASVAGAEKCGVSSRGPQRGGEEAGSVGLDTE